jgi:hypothetical protein
MEVGIVTGVPTTEKEYPGMAILYDRAGNPLPAPETVNLAEPDPMTGRLRRTVLGTVNPLLLPPVPLESILAHTTG